MKWEESIFPLKKSTQIMQEPEQNLQQEAEETLGIQSPGETKESSPIGLRPREATRETAGQDGQGKFSKIPVLHTLKGDISEYIKTRGVSLSEILAEATKRRRFDEQESPETRRFLFLTGGIIALVAILAIGGWLLFFKEKPTVPGTNLQPPKSLILSDRQETAALKSEERPELIAIIQKSPETPVEPGAVLVIPFLLQTDPKEYIQAVNFFDILGTNLPINLNQSLEGRFTFGIFNNRKQNQPFLILEINSFDLAFSGMLDWEKNMAKDLKEVLQIQNISTASQKFQDKVIKNQNTRILYDASNNPVIMYAILKGKYIAVSKDTDTFEEIIRRFSLSP